MRKKILALLAVVLWFGFSPMGHSGAALADGMVLPLPETLNPDYVAVRYHHVQVQIEDNHAVTRVEQAFYNPHDYPIQGQYLFPIPPEAILSHFEATVDGVRQQVIRQDAEATNAALYAIIAQQRDPSLLQYADWETLVFDFELPAGGSRTMSLQYEEVLAPSGGLYRYRYVLSTERYSLEPLEEASIRVEIASSSGLATLYSSSHPVVIKRSGPDRATVSWEASYVQPTQDFELFFSPAEGGFGGGFLTGRMEDHDHFLFLFSPDGEGTRDDALPKDIVFVMDRSGSMSGEKIDQARNALQFILGQLGEEDRFSIVSFDERISILADRLQPVSAGTLAEAARYVDRLSADGSTDLEAALQTGLEILEQSGSRGAPRLVVFLTDGLPTAGITDEGLIARLVTGANAGLEARLHVFGVGYDVNTHLLDRLAADNGGTVTYVQPEEDLEAALTGFYTRIAHPVLTGVEIEFEGLQASELYPQKAPDLFQGSSLLLAGRYRATGDRITVRVRGWAGDERQEYAYTFALDNTGDRSFVPRLWATRRIGALLDRVRVEGESPALVDEIRDLGLGYGLATPYTTFAIEGQAEGAASAANMALYGAADLNQASGQTTIMARVQNQAYQQATQADLAAGANVVHSGQRNLAQVGVQNVDLSLLKGQSEVDGPLDSGWLEDNVQIDQMVAFGSEAYFALAKDPAARAYLQSGTNVVFSHQGQVISVQDQEKAGPQSSGPDVSQGAGATAIGPADQAPIQTSNRPELTQAGKWGIRMAGALLELLASLVR